MRCFLSCTFHQILTEDDIGGVCSTNGRDTTFTAENLKERDYSECLGIDRIIILEWFIEKWIWMVQTGFIWVTIWTSSGFS
jgi:hypothetical protein